jgi:hypothetical protein
MRNQVCKHAVRPIGASGEIVYRGTVRRQRRTARKWTVTVPDEFAGRPTIRKGWADTENVKNLVATLKDPAAQHFLATDPSVKKHLVAAVTSRPGDWSAVTSEIQSV